MYSTAVNLEPGQYVEGWNPITGRLFLPALSDSNLGAEVAVRVGILGQSIRATLFGKVSSVRRIGRPSLPPGVELALDNGSLAAAGFLALAAQGKPVSFRERSPRYLAERTLLVAYGTPPVEQSLKTLNISEGGCALEWPEDVPEPGAVVQIRLKASIFTASVRSVVCWSAHSSSGSGPVSVGLRVVTRGFSARAWKALVAEIVKAGARAI